MWSWRYKWYVFQIDITPKIKEILKKFFISHIGKHSGLKPDEDGHIYKVDEDKFLKMSGPYGVEGRSVVIHLPGTAKTRLDCANIYSCKD